MSVLELVQSVAVGDALGAPYEDKIPGSLPRLPRESFLNPQTETPERKVVRVLGGRAPYGTWTDDTQVVLLVCDAIRRFPKDPTSAYRENLLAWEQGAFTPSGRRLDAGVQMRMALREIRAGRSTAPTRSSGNGCLMVAIGVYAAGRDEHIEQLVRTTHNSDKAVSDAAALLDILHRHELPVISPAELAVTAPTGFSEDTLLHSIYRAQESSTFLEGIDQILAAGGDTDSIGAVYAAISATHGRPAPTELQHTLVGLDVIAHALGESRDEFDAPTCPTTESSAPKEPGRRWWQWRS